MLYICINIDQSQSFVNCWRDQQKFTTKSSKHQDLFTHNIKFINGSWRNERGKNNVIIA